MANCLFLLNAGGNILLNAGGELQMNDDTCVEASLGGTGGRVRKATGSKLTTMDLGPRPSSIQSGESIARIILKETIPSKGKRKLSYTGESKCISIPHQMGESLAKIIHKTVAESSSQLLFYNTNESFAVPHQSIQMGRQIRLSKLLMLKEIAEKVIGLEKPSSIRTFEFNETIHNEQLIAFTHSSSWIGNVRYDTDTLEMRILMNGKAYNFCGVPRRVYDGFEGSPSKGEFYWRELRQLYDC